MCVFKISDVQKLFVGKISGVWKIANYLPSALFFYPLTNAINDALFKGIYLQST